MEQQKNCYIVVINYTNMLLCDVGCMTLANKKKYANFLQMYNLQF